MKSAAFSRPVTVAIGAAMLLAASVVQAFQATPPVTLQSLAGHYQGYAKWSDGEAPPSRPRRCPTARPA